ncbi:MAG TPA: methylmalonyl Co-A mutase-associated GTPase MeaB [Limnochordales bacterium]
MVATPSPQDSASEIAALVAALRQGSRRALARAITYVENYDPRRTALLQALPPATELPYIVGITGPPGAGKSSLIGALTTVLRQRGRRVGIVAVDPDSPLTGGAVLGDRIRMLQHTEDDGVYIRSMSSRGNPGGLARATWEVLQVLAGAGFDVLIVETTGVGQTELAIRHFADTVVLVVTPGGGDAIQAIKSGIMEVAHVFAVNKADLPGADVTASQLKQALNLRPSQDWRPPVLPVISTTNEGIAALWEAIESHYAAIEQAGGLAAVRRDRMYAQLSLMAESELRARFHAYLRNRPPSWDDLMRRLARGQTSPSLAAEELVDQFIETSCSRGGPPLV